MRLTLGAAAAVFVAVVAVVLLTRGDDTTEATTPASESEVDAVAPSTNGCPAEDGSSPRTLSFDGPQPMCIDPSQTHVAVFDTSEGEIRVTLDTESTPNTANNFITLARWGYYDGTTIHRTAPAIDIIQGGSPNTESASDPGPGYTIPDEPQFEADGSGAALSGPYRYVPGQLVMARTPLVDSASAQYFFTAGPLAAGLDNQGIYVVFGQTDDAGLGVVQDILGLHAPAGEPDGAPSRPVTINTVTIEVS